MPDSVKPVIESMKIQAARKHDEAKSRNADIWKGQDKTAKLLNGTVHIKGVPESPEEYEQRKADIITACEALGYEAHVSSYHAGERNPVSGMTQLYREKLFVNGPGSQFGYGIDGNLYIGMTRNGQDFTGLIAAETWVRNEVKEHQEKKDAEALAAQNAIRQAEAREEASKARPVTAGELEEFKAVIKSQVAVILERIEYLSVVVKAG